MTQKTASQEMVFELSCGNYDVYATPDGMAAVVVDQFMGRQVKQFEGESAWADAGRYAGDLEAARNR